ncbi:MULTISPECIES: hypothetical protein [unclassified Microbacterium]|uniref:hypothetical protein n=1 Tax=unclassified Microbacterium TaxID=2609290 RepID=UPI00301031A8
MALADDVQALKTSRPRDFKAWLKIAAPEERDEVLTYVYDNSIPENGLAVLLSGKHGIPITRETIVRLRESRR